MLKGGKTCYKPMNEKWDTVINMKLPKIVKECMNNAFSVIISQRFEHTSYTIYIIPQKKRGLN